MWVESYSVKSLRLISFFHSAQFLGESCNSFCTSIVYSFLLPSRIPWYGCTIVCWIIHLLKDIWANSGFWSIYVQVFISEGEVPKGANELLKNIFFLSFFRERGKEGERKGEKHGCTRDTLIGCLSYTPNWEPGPQARHMPWLGIEPATSVHWATPARAKWTFNAVHKSRVMFGVILHWIAFSPFIQSAVRFRVGLPPSSPWPWACVNFQTD